MTRQEFDAWKTETARSVNRWTVDPCHTGPTALQPKNDFLAYKGTAGGGVSGSYLSVDPAGLVTVGTYCGAIPHIGEAMFTITGRHQCKNFDDGLSRVLSALGLDFAVEFLTARNAA